MTQFEFLSVFISIVLAFGVSDILSSWGEQVRLRKDIKHYWLHVAWGFLVLVVMVQAWWGLWRLRDINGWYFFDYLILIVPYLLLSFIAYVLTPAIKEGKTDIKRYYYENTPWFFGLFATYTVSAIINTNNALGTPFLDRTNIVRGLAIVLSVFLAFWKNEIFHIISVVAGFVLLAAWVGLTMFAI